MSQYEKSSNGVLFDKFGVPPFSILDSKQKYWVSRKNEWKDFGIKSEDGRDVTIWDFITAKRLNVTSWMCININFPNKKYNIIYADPPWSYGFNWGNKV